MSVRQAFSGNSRALGVCLTKVGGFFVEKQLVSKCFWILGATGSLLPVPSDFHSLLSERKHWQQVASATLRLLRARLIFCESRARSKRESPQNGQCSSRAKSVAESSPMNVRITPTNSTPVADCVFL